MVILRSLHTDSPQQWQLQAADTVLVLLYCAGGTYIDGLVQERRNSNALAMELHLYGTNLSISSTSPIST